MAINLLKDPLASTVAPAALRGPKATRHYAALDGLRGVAALTVVLYHIALYFQLALIPVHAYLAVDFFFMLSGYVIAYAYDHRLASSMSWRRFVLVRLIRLYPLALLGVVIGTVALLIRACLGAGVPTAAVLEAAFFNALLLPTNALLMVRPFAFPTDSPLWSLAFELWINILYALCFSLISRRVLWGLLMIGAVLVALASAASGGLNIGLYFNSLYLGIARVLFPFVAGLMLQQVLSQRVRPDAQGGWRLAHAAFMPLLALLCWPAFGSWLYDAFAVLIAFPAVLSLSANTAAMPRLDKIWGRLGAISYPLYVTHFPFVVVISNLAHQRHLHGAPLYIAALATFAITLIVSVLALKFYDVPLRRFLANRLNPYPAAKHTEAAHAQSGPIRSSFPPHA